jgi:hypothetical protein
LGIGEELLVENEGKWHRMENAFYLVSFSHDSFEILKQETQISRYSGHSVPGLPLSIEFRGRH